MKITEILKENGLNIEKTIVENVANKNKETFYNVVKFGKDFEEEFLKDFLFQPFSFVLVRKNTNGYITSGINFGFIKNFKPITAFMELLRFSLCEKVVTTDLYSGLEKYDIQTLKNGVWKDEKGYKDGIRNSIAKSLNTQVIYITGKDGKICNVIYSDVLLRDTFLNIDNCKGLLVVYYDVLAGKNYKELTEALHTFGEKAMKQCSYFSNVSAKVAFFAKFIENAEKAEAAEKKKEEARKKRVAEREAKAKAYKEAKAKEEAEKAKAAKTEKPKEAEKAA